MVKSGDKWHQELSRLVALAERLASEGQMNLNKLVEAAIYGELRSAGWHYRPQVTAANMETQLEASIRFLKLGNTSPDLISAMEMGRQALAAHKGSDLLLAEAPDPFVCRTCGNITLDSAPTQCADCGAWPGRFRKFVALFNGDNMEPTNPYEVLALLASNAEDLGWLVQDLTDEVTHQKPSGSDWSIHEHVAHFSDTQDMLETRLELMLEVENPELTALPVYEFATEAERHPPSTRTLLGEFRANRMKCVDRLRALPLKDLWRTGHHPEFGQLTVLRQAAYLAFHEQTHLSEIEDLRKQVT